MFLIQNLATTSSPLAPLKLDLLDLSDKIISLQFEILRFSASPIEKEKYSSTLKELQNLLNDLLANLADSDPNKAKEKIRLIQEALDQLKSDFDAFKVTTTTAEPSTVQQQVTSSKSITFLFFK